MTTMRPYEDAGEEKIGKMRNGEKTILNCVKDNR